MTPVYVPIHNIPHRATKKLRRFETLSLVLAFLKGLHLLLELNLLAVFHHITTDDESSYSLLYKLNKKIFSAL